MDHFPAPETLSLPPGSIPKGKPIRTRAPRHRRGEMFLRGPIPLHWITIASHLGGKALHVGLAIWFFAGMKRSRIISLNLSQPEKFGFDRFSGSRALAALEKAGLVLVERHPGRKPVVTILDGAKLSPDGETP